MESIATDLPPPKTILLGGQATETDFKRLPLGQYEVIHLALHGYADPEFPDRSALVFAPENPPIDDGLLQVREIRQLHLNASLVTLSACDTGVGPVGEEGVADIVNAFIEAGAQSVVSALWEINDQATAKLMIDFYRQLGRGESKGRGSESGADRHDEVRRAALLLGRGSSWMANPAVASSSQTDRLPLSGAAR